MLTKLHQCTKTTAHTHARASAFNPLIKIVSETKPCREFHLALRHVFFFFASTSIDFFAPPSVKSPVKSLFHTCQRYENPVSHRCCDLMQLMLSSYFCRTTGRLTRRRWVKQNRNWTKNTDANSLRYWSFIFYDFLFFCEWRKRTRCWDPRLSDVVPMEWGKSTSGYAISAGKLEIIAHSTNARYFLSIKTERICSGSMIPSLPPAYLHADAAVTGICLTWTQPGSIHRTAMYRNHLEFWVGEGRSVGGIFLSMSLIICYVWIYSAQVSVYVGVADDISAGLRKVIRQFVLTHLTFPSGKNVCTHVILAVHTSALWWKIDTLD